MSMPGQQAAADFDPFKGDTGLKDDFDGYVADAWWATDPTNTRDPNALFGFLKIAADDGEEIDVRYSTGAGWASYDGGHVAEHEKDAERRRGFNVNTAYFLLVAKAMEVGAEQEMRNRSASVLNGQGPRWIDGLWKGLKFHWEVETEEMSFTDRTTNEPVKRTVNRLLPTAFLGVVGVATSSAAPAPPNSPAPSAPSPGMPQPQPGSGFPVPGMPSSPSASAPTPQAPAPANVAPNMATALDMSQMGQAQGIAQPGPVQQPAPIEQPPAAPPVAEAPTTVAEAQTAQAPAAGTPDWSWWSNLPPTFANQLVQIAKSQDYNHFVDEVISLPEAASVNQTIPQFMVALSDDLLYNQLRLM